MKHFKFDLQRFSEGGSSGAASSSAAAPVGNATGNQSPTEKTNGGTDGQSTNVDNTADRKSRYEQLKAEYKDFYDADVQTHVKNRHKDYGKIKADKEAQDEFLSTLHTKYGTSDLKGLQDAIDADEGFWRDQADQADMTVEQYKEHIKLKRQAESANSKLREIEVQERAKAQYNAWYEESKEVKAEYPEFDLNTELQNPHFRSMLSANYSGGYMPSMKAIYELVHRDEIAERQKAAVQKNTIDNIKARGLRPDEAGSNSNGAVDYTLDASRMSSKERADIARRVKMGEKFSFNR